MAPCFFFLGYSSAGGFLETWSSGTTRRPGLLLRSTVTPREASLWMGRIARPVAAAGRETQGWRSSMLDAVPGLPSARSSTPTVSGIRFWWGLLEEGASTLGEVPDR